jgi:hypothetical protein
MSNSETHRYNLVTVHDKSTMQYSPAEANLDLVRNIIYEREHPHPGISIGLVIAIVAMMYIVHKIFIRRNISGIWFGSIDDTPSAIRYEIKHNPISDSLRVTTEDGEVMVGELIGHTVWLNSNGQKKAGVLTSSNKIVWVDSKDVWNSVKILS